MQPATRARLYRGLFRIQVWAVGVSAAVGLLLKAPAEKIPDWFAVGAALVRWFQSEAWWIIPGCAVVLGVARAGRTKLGEPWAWEGIQDILGKIRAHVVKSDGPVHHHRVTLFKKVQWCWWPNSRPKVWWPWGSGNGPSSGWLISVARSDATILNRVVFLAPDRQPDMAEGVAGQAWCLRRRSVWVSDLPAVTTQSPDADLEAYAAKTFISKDRLKRDLASKKTPGRAFWGIPIEVQGRLWGVIVIDSRQPDGLKKKLDASTTNLIDVLSGLAKRA